MTASVNYSMAYLSKKTRIYAALAGHDRVCAGCMQTYGKTGELYTFCSDACLQKFAQMDWAKRINQSRRWNELRVRYKDGW